MFGHRTKPTARPLERVTNKGGTESFTFLSPFSNLDLYPEMDYPPYLNMRRHPTMLDVIRVRHYLSSKLPTEIIDLVVDLAEYWPHTSSILDMTTRVYHDHMRYGSYGRAPKSKGRNRSNTPGIRREWPDIGFILRTPPLGIRCVQSDDPRRGYVPSFVSRFRKKAGKGDNKMPDWLPPRGKNPARIILFEILSREERLTDSLQAPGYRQHSTSLFEASVDMTTLPRIRPPSSMQPLQWTTNAAITKSYHRNTFDLSEVDVQYSFQPRQSTSANPDLPQAFPVTWNREAHNRKYVIAYRYDDSTPYSAEKERFLSSDIVRGFVRGLKEGDSIALWARALEGAGPCCNIVDRVKIHVFWAV